MFAKCFYRTSVRTGSCIATSRSFRSSNDFNNFIKVHATYSLLRQSSMNIGRFYFEDLLRSTVMELRVTNISCKASDWIMITKILTTSCGCLKYAALKVQSKSSTAWAAPTCVQLTISNKMFLVLFNVLRNAGLCV